MEELIKELEALAQMETCKDRDENFGIGLTRAQINPVSAYVKGQRDMKIVFSRELVEKLKGITNDNKDI